VTVAVERPVRSVRLAPICPQCGNTVPVQVRGVVRLPGGVLGANRTAAVRRLAAHMRLTCPKRETASPT
jgi:hypothetical protein